VRLRLANAGLRRLLDSADICQSVLASFFVRLAAGQYQIDTKEDLLNLLVTMAQHKIANQARRERAERRDSRRTKSVGRWADRLVASTPSPSHEVARRELLAEAERRLSAEERQLVALRKQGQSWEQIAVLVCVLAQEIRNARGSQYTFTVEAMGEASFEHEFVNGLLANFNCRLILLRFRDTNKDPRAAIELASTEFRPEYGKACRFSLSRFLGSRGGGANFSIGNGLGIVRRRRPGGSKAIGPNNWSIGRSHLSLLSSALPSSLAVTRTRRGPRKLPARSANRLPWA
jgi:DNA-directed RNA polymerase specialized sigma24 family protein